jgi:dCTP deaminase
MPTFDELIPHIGFLTDREINAAIEAGFLIEKGTHTAEQIRHASYTLRLGAEVHISKPSNGQSSPRKEFVVHRLTKQNASIEIPPGHTALLYCLERIRLPDNVLGFTIARGLLFAEALSPENTYIDPGFPGSVCTTITNISDRTVTLQYEMPIARLFFYRLSEPVREPYRSGSAFGIAQQLESVHVGPLRTQEDCRRATDAQLVENIKLIPLGGLPAAETIRRLSDRLMLGQFWTVVLVILWPPLLLVVNSSEWIKNNLGGFVGNVAASVVAALVVYGVAKVRTFYKSRKAA